MHFPSEPSPVHQHAQDLSPLDLLPTDPQEGLGSAATSVAAMPRTRPPAQSRQQTSLLTPYFQKVALSAPALLAPPASLVLPASLTPTQEMALGSTMTSLEPPFASAGDAARQAHDKLGQPDQAAGQATPAAMGPARLTRAQQLQQQASGHFHPNHLRFMRSSSNRRSHDDEDDLLFNMSELDMSDGLRGQHKGTR
nr:hypothetical protein HK105_001107 [Polyrhizophydium stewartii]